MHYVYVIVSVRQPERYYVGLTNEVRWRLCQHNQGSSGQRLRLGLGGFGQLSAFREGIVLLNSNAI
jgi:hypothetical protein